MAIRLTATIRERAQLPSIWPQVVRARANNRLTPAQARRRREELARVPEFLLCIAYCILVPSVLLGPCVVIWVTNADPLQAAPLTFAVRLAVRPAEISTTVLMS